MRSSLDLGNDIRYFKAVIDKYKDKYIGNNESNEDQIIDFHNRVDFVVFQFKDIFNNNF